MLTERFTRLFGRLLDRWVDYQEAPRDPARVTELAAARAALDEVRSEIRQENHRSSEALRTAAGPRVAISDSDLSKLRVAAIGLEGTA